MQKVMLVLLLFFGTQAIAQDEVEIEFPVDEETGLAKYEGVTTVSGVDADELYNRALKWINKFYKNPTRVVTKKDPEAGLIEGQARFTLDAVDKKGRVTKNVGFVAYNFQIRVRDGRYKYVVTKIRVEGPSYYDVTRWYDKNQTGYNEVKFQAFIKQTLDYMDKMLDGMEEGMKSAEKVKSDDW